MKTVNAPSADFRPENPVPRLRVWPGSPSPLGATFDGRGVNFALFSEHATKVELCLFDSPDAQTESHRIALPEKTHQVWHGYLPDLRPGQIYGYRVHGPNEPARGHRFNPRKVLLDPYAKVIARDLAGTMRCSIRSATPPPSRRSPASSIPPSLEWTTGRRARRGTRR